MGAKILDFLMKKKETETKTEHIDLVSKISWRDIDAETLKAFFLQWETYAEKVDADTQLYGCHTYDDGYRDAILDLIDHIGDVCAAMPEPVLDLDGWHK